MKCNFKPYEGSSPYIFVSYSHKDMPRISPVLEAMNLAGYHIWYDDGIEAGSVWTDSIASHLSNCAVCLAFHSKSSKESLNCLQEIHYVVDLISQRKNISILSVYLDDVRLSQGLDMQLSVFQHIYYFQDDLEAIVERLKGNSILAPCRGKVAYDESEDDEDTKIFDPEYTKTYEFEHKNTSVSVWNQSVPDVRNGSHAKKKGIPSTWKRVFAGKLKIIAGSAACMLLLLFGLLLLGYANRAEWHTDGEIRWSLNRRGVLTIAGADSQSYEIPDYEYDYDIVTEKTIATKPSTAPWSESREKIVSVRIQNGATYIGNYAFSACVNLAHVNIPNGVRIIGDSAFHGCSDLTGVSLPEGLSEIGVYAFYGCSSLTCVTVPSSCSTVNFCAFENCEQLDSIEVQGGNHSYSSLDGVLYDKNQITLLRYPENRDGVFSVPDSVTSIDSYAFSGCSKLMSVKLPDALVNIRDNAFANAVSLSGIVIPDSVTQIGSEAFSGCSNLVAVRIPDSVSSITWNAFRNCTRLIAIEVGAGNQQYSSLNGILYNADKTKLMSCPTGKEGMIELPESVVKIESYAFENCANLSTVILPDGLEIIDGGAFKGCFGLAEIKIPDSVTKIGDYAFAGCSSLANIEMPDSVTEIGDGVFMDCSSLIHVAIPEGITNIGLFLFQGCSSLVHVKIPESVSVIEMSAFQECASLAQITLPSQLKSIEGLAFVDCAALKDLSIPDTLERIGDFAFARCEQLTSMTIPTYVERIDQNPFFGCVSLKEICVSPENANYTSVDGILYSKDKTQLQSYPAGKEDAAFTVPASITEICNEAFRGCAYLEEVVIPNIIEVVPVFAFADCPCLARVTLPDGVTAIGERAFRNCANLTDITIPDSVTLIMESAFEGCAALTEMMVPGEADVSSEAFDSSVKVLRKR